MWDNFDAGYRPRRPANFTGEEKESWHDWLLNFERIRRSHMAEDDETTICSIFGDCLSGQALSFFNRLPRRSQYDWEAVKEAFEERFGLEHGSYKHKAALDALRWRGMTPQWHTSKSL